MNEPPSTYSSGAALQRAPAPQPPQESWLRLARAPRRPGERRARPAACSASPRSRAASSTISADTRSDCRENATISALSHTTLITRGIPLEKRNTARSAATVNTSPRGWPATSWRSRRYAAVSCACSGRIVWRSSMRCRSWRSCGRAELLAELRLTDQHDLQQLRLRRLEVRQHANLFEHRLGQVLRLVDDQERLLAAFEPLDQIAIQARERGALAERHDRLELELLEDHREKVVDLERGVEDEGRLHRRTRASGAARSGSWSCPCRPRRPA